MDKTNVSKDLTCTDNYLWEDWTDDERKIFMLFDKMNKFKIYRNKFPTWEGKGFRVRGDNKKTQYAYGNDIEQSRSCGWKEIYINPKNKQISMFVAKIDKKLWINIPFKYEWYSKSQKSTNIYNMKLETENHIALFWIYDKFVIRDSKINKNYQIVRHNKLLNDLESVLEDYNPEIIDCGYVPNPWYYYGVMVKKEECYHKTKLKFDNILTDKERKKIRRSLAKNASENKISKTKEKLFSVRTVRPLSVRKLANFAGVSANTVQKYRKELESLGVLKRIKT